MPREVRSITQCNAKLTSLAPSAASDLKSWLEEQAATYSLKWLLAHADDGVIWGRVDDKALKLSSDVSPKISPPLRNETLQMARLFGVDAELLLWRDGDNAWRARLIKDNVPTKGATYQEAIDERYILWGTEPEDVGGSFTLIRDGVEGLVHVLPIQVAGKYDIHNRPLRLHVRHYLTEDELGFVRIATSRLVDLLVEKES